MISKDDDAGGKIQNLPKRGAKGKSTGPLSPEPLGPPVVAAVLSAEQLQGKPQAQDDPRSVGPV